MFVKEKMKNGIKRIQKLLQKYIHTDNNNIINIIRNNNSRVNRKWIIWKNRNSKTKNKICISKRNS